jgi:AcrR family transcriptional regulator
MGRPKEYDERTAESLLDAAEKLVAEGGVGALSVRRLAAAIGATNQAVYSLFGSKDGLVIALGTRAFNLLSDGLDTLPATDDPAGDLVEGAVVVFRHFTLKHPALFRIGFLRTNVPAEVARKFLDAQERSLARLTARIERLEQVGQLGTRTARQALLELDALCEGLAAVEGRRVFGPEDAEFMWRDALRSLVSGWAATG